MMSSETGVLDIPAENIERKGRLEPGRMFLVDLEQGRIVEDEEIKDALAARKPYGKWLTDNKISLAELDDVDDARAQRREAAAPRCGRRCSATRSKTCAS